MTDGILYNDNDDDDDETGDDEAPSDETPAEPVPLVRLQGLPLDVRLVRVVLGKSYEPAAVLRVSGAGGPVNVIVRGVWRLKGEAVLSGARIELPGGTWDAPHGVRFVAADGALEVLGEASAEVAAAGELALPEPRAIDVAAWVALVDVLNERSRWDYEIDPCDAPDDRPSLALRGTSGAYDRGISVRFFGVVRAFVTRFSHPVFEIREVTDEGVALAIRASAGVEDTELHVVARAAEMEDEGPIRKTAFERDDAAPSRTEAAAVTPLAVALAAEPFVRRLVAAFLARGPAVPRARGGALPGAEGVESRALAAVMRRVRADAGAEAALRNVPVVPAAWMDDTALAVGLTGLLERRGDMSPKAVAARVCPPLASVHVRDAALRGARRLVGDYLAVATFATEEAYVRCRDEHAALPEPAPSQRLREDAAREAAVVLARHILDLPARTAVLDLAQVTTGRVLFDPAVESALPEDERLARAVGLKMLDAQREAGRGKAGETSLPAIRDLLPDPSARARMSAAEPLFARLAARVPALAEELVQRTSLDEEELAFFLAEDRDALRLYRLLSAVLVGHPVFAPPA